MQFTTTEEHVRLVERAKALLARSSPGVSLGELHRKAMQLLVEQLEKQRFATQARRPSPKAEEAERAKPVPSTDGAPRQRGDETPPSANPAPRQRGDETPTPETAAPRQRGRHIPAAVKREVFAREAGCCSYIDERGQRCSETRYLELHHLEPFARGGEHLASNLALRCAAHNALAAEEDFGQRAINGKRTATRHDSLSATARASTGALGFVPRRCE